MKLGIYKHLGALTVGGNAWAKTLDEAKRLREGGVEHVAFCNLPVETLKAGDKTYRDELALLVNPRLRQLEEIGVTVAVRPNPAISEQVVLEQRYVITGSPDVVTKAYTPDDTIRRTSIMAVNALDLGQHYVYASHECHDRQDGHQRAWLVRQLGDRTVLYYGHQGLWNKYGADFPEHDLPHVVHVALNTAGANDASGSKVPLNCTPSAVSKFSRDAFARIPGDWATLRTLAHINVTPETTAARMVALLAEACFDIVLLRLVSEHGQTIHDPTPAMLEAIREMSA